MILMTLKMIVVFRGLPRSYCLHFNLYKMNQREIGQVLSRGMTTSQRGKSKSQIVSNLKLSTFMLTKVEMDLKLGKGIGK